MCEHEQKYCPRCNSQFECKVGSILICQCTALPLNDQERSFIQAQFVDCLCLPCLKEMKAAYHAELFRNKLTTISPLRFKKEQ
ncbi:cysteine-rich CWC family protein [Chitinophaga sp.]|uniref:cysteine-rich CWC family protein n=1 Tax=Chitinophaga sp. TaxID=1869181 RepID=UPI002F937653